MLTFPGKQKTKDPRVIALYNDYEHAYLTGYALHTALRLQEDGLAAAIGGDWEPGGARQLACLQAQGLAPTSRLLDLGCGTGRLARLAAPYLAPGHYTGVDVCPEVLVAAQALADEEGWAPQAPTFVHTPTGAVEALAGQTFDLVWIYAVWIHNPPEVIEACLRSLAALRFGQVLFTWKNTPRDVTTPLRTSYKQFACPWGWFVRTGKRCGLTVVPWSGLPQVPQAMGRITRA